MNIDKPEWRCTLTVNEAANVTSSWRERLAWRVRRWADRLDGKGRTVTPRQSFSSQVRPTEHRPAVLIKKKMR